MRSWCAALIVAVACSSSDDVPAPAPESARDAMPQVAIAPDAHPTPSRKPAWTFAVLSDLHLPNYFTSTVDRTIAALIEHGVRLVVITGDHTNGSPLDGPARKDKWWAAVTKTLQPLRDAGIPVLPVAGNHDSYLPVQRASYAAAFDPSWAKPLVIENGDGPLTRWPFSYSVDVDGVHLSLAHIVATRLEPSVATWLAADLQAAKAKHKIVFAHNPLSSVIWSPSKVFVAQLGGILDRGGATMFVAGHEHVVWDENVGTLRQVLVGCASGYYDYAPSEPSKVRAKCRPVIHPGKIEPMRCQMPNGGAFEIARGRKRRHIQHYKNAFVLIDVDGDELRVRPMTVDPAGRMQPFYLPD